MKTINKKCRYCGNDIKVEPREHNRGNGNYCNQSCSAKYHNERKEKPGPNSKCALCGKEFYKKPSSKKGSKSGLFFCCREHKDKAQRIGGIKEIHPPQYGTDKSRYAYRATAFDNYEPCCSICGYDTYKSVLCVHHKDRDRTNGSLDNLEILCPTCHAEKHYLSGTGLWWWTKRK